MLLGLLLSLSLFLPDVALLSLPSDTPIKVVSVTASSTMPKWQGYTFEARNLIDGRVDTSWQPRKSDTLGVGQWVELDLGAYYQVSRIEIEHGLQAVDPKLGDLYCRNNRMSQGYLWFENGTFAFIWEEGDKRTSVVEGFYRRRESSDTEAPAVTRRLRLVVTMALEPVDWKDLAIAEIRVFGRPASPPVVDPERIAWDQPGSYPLKAAIADLCAGKNAKAQRDHDCWMLISNFSVGGSFEPLPPVDALALGTGRFISTFIDSHFPYIRHTVDFERDAGGRWVVRLHDRRHIDSGKAAEPAHSSPVALDDKAMNECWEKLGKTRPDYPIDPDKRILPDNDIDELNNDSEVPAQAETK